MDHSILKSKVTILQNWWKSILVKNKFPLYSYVITTGLKREELNDNVFLIVGNPIYKDSIRIPVKHWSSTRKISVDFTKADKILLIKPHNLLDYKNVIMDQIVEKTKKKGLIPDFTFHWFNFPNRKSVNQSVGMKPFKVCDDYIHFSTIETFFQKNIKERQAILKLILTKSFFHNPEDELLVKGIALLCTFSNNISWVQAYNFIEMNQQIEKYALENPKKILIISPEHQLFIKMYVLAIEGQRGGNSISSRDPRMFQCLFWCKTDYLRVDSHLSIIDPVPCIKLFVEEIIACKNLSLEEQKTECCICYEEKEKYLCNSCYQCNKFLCFSCYDEYLQSKERDLLDSNKDNITITCPHCRNVNAKLLR